MASKNELAVFLAGGRMFESQTASASSKFKIEKLTNGDWEINLRMTISSQDAGKSIFNLADLALAEGVEPKDISNLIFINGVKVEDPATAGVIKPNSIIPKSSKLLIGGNPNSALGHSGGAQLHFIIDIEDAGKTDQGKTDQPFVE